MKKIIDYIYENINKKPIELSDLLDMINNDKNIVDQLKRKYDHWELEERTLDGKKKNVIYFYKNGAHNSHGSIHNAYEENGKIYIECFSMYGGRTTSSFKNFVNWV